MIYRKRDSVSVDAVQWLGDNLAEVWDWAGSPEGIFGPFSGDYHLMIVNMHERKDDVNVGDWVVREPLTRDRYRKVPADVFEAMYEPVEAPAADIPA